MRKKFALATAVAVGGFVALAGLTPANASEHHVTEDSPATITVLPPN